MNEEIRYIIRKWIEALSKGKGSISVEFSPGFKKSDDLFRMHYAPKGENRPNLVAIYFPQTALMHVTLRKGPSSLSSETATLLCEERRAFEKIFRSLLPTPEQINKMQNEAEIQRDMSLTAFAFPE